MVIKKHTNVRIISLACFLFSTAILAACSAQSIAVTPSPLPTNTPLPPTAIPPTPTTIPRPLLSADKVKTLSAELERISNAHFQAWMNRDPDLRRQIYTVDVHFHADNKEWVHTLNEMIAFETSFASENPNLECRLVDTFIGSEDGFVRDDCWNAWGTTKDNPELSYDWFTLRNGKISYWWTFTSDENLATLDPPTIVDQKLLQDYATAWSSGDPEEVASLYDPETVRSDSLYGESQQGSSTVKEFATKFFTWYPGVRLELLQSFGENPISIKNGGEYVFHVFDQAGQLCDVSAIILLEPSQDKIIKEWVFYNADSLIACGWAQ
jgi:hypothetical protein